MHKIRFVLVTFNVKLSHLSILNIKRTTKFLVFIIITRDGLNQLLIIISTTYSFTILW